MTRSSFERLRTEQDQLRQQVGFLQHVRLRPQPAPRRRRATQLRWAWLGAASLGAALLTGFLLGRPAGIEPLGFTVGDSERRHVGAFVAAPPDRELPLNFADGTRIALAPGSSARVARLDAQGAHLVIERGRALAAVVHRSDSRWRVDVGPFQVAVVGTRFDVSWDAAARVLDLRLDEGAVRVSGGLLREMLDVRAGQRLRVLADGAHVELSGREESERHVSDAHADAETAPDAATPDAPRPPHRSDKTTASGGVSAPLWRQLAAEGKFRDALAAAEQAGFEAECKRAVGADLLALGDAARLSGSAKRAAQAYEAAHEKLPGGGRASYGLGLVAFNLRGDFVGAAQHFETYLREQPSGALRAEASGRLMEAWQRAGRLNEARRVAEQYLARYPQGPHAVRAKQLLQ